MLAERPSRSAALTVAALIASAGLIPTLTIRANSLPLSPCAETPVSVPKAIFTPLAMARLWLSIAALAATSAFSSEAFERAPARAWSRAVFGASMVGTK